MRYFCAQFTGPSLLPYCMTTFVDSFHLPINDINPFIIIMALRKPIRTVPVCMDTVPLLS